MFHTDCFAQYVQSYENRNMALLCPLCRQRIDKDRVVKRVIRIEEHAPVGVEDAFDLKKEGQADVVEMASVPPATGPALLVAPPAGAPAEVQAPYENYDSARAAP